MAVKKKVKGKAVPRKTKSKPAIKTTAESETFCTPDTTQSQVVLVDDELRKLANDYIETWHQCSADWIKQELPDLRARFLNLENAEAALIRAREYVTYVVKKGAPKISLPNEAKSENLQLPSEIILPEIFSLPAGDIAESTKEHDVKRGCDVEAAKLYLALFTESHFKRLILKETNAARSDERAIAFENTKRAHQSLILYLQAMVKQSRNHIVKISKDLVVEIDGKVVACKGAAKRSLFSLVLMRDEQSFRAAEFNNLFYGSGHCVGEPASEFTTAIRGAIKLLPCLVCESSKGLRSIKGVHFVVLASNEQLKTTIAKALGESTA